MRRAITITRNVDGLSVAGMTMCELPAREAPVWPNEMTNLMTKKERKTHDVRWGVRLLQLFEC